jgi:hypothetical protein
MTNPSSEKFDSLLQEIDHYKSYPNMKPFIGEQYEAPNHRKLLLIGESFYFPKSTSIHLNADTWYSGKQSDLTKEASSEQESPLMFWINCRGLLQCSWKAPGHKIYSELNNRLKEVLPTSDQRAVSNIAYMNAFQRPAIEKDSIKNSIKDIDIEVAIKTINDVLKIIKPEIVIFVSKFSWDTLKSKLTYDKSKTELHFVCHPATGGLWWNKKNYKNGKQKFMTLLENNFLTK